MTPISSHQNHLHFIGIGGIGMSALALILKKRGFSISGSDKIQNKSTLKLEKLGIQIFYKQEASNLDKINIKNKTKLIFIISSAIPEDNEELKKAKKNQEQIIYRSDLLNDLIKKQKSILIAGSHGKTTTSTLISTLLAENKQDPTAIIGGIVPYFQSNAHAGKGEFVVAEIDESDGSITKYSGTYGVITNLELDHTDYYKTFNSLKSAMQIFANKCNYVIANYDCSNLRKYLSNKTIWWSTKEFKNIHFAAIPIFMNGSKTVVNYYEDGQLIDKIIIPIPGIHNLNNCLGSIATLRTAGISFDKIKSHIHSLKTPNRRFEFKGMWEGRQIIDDYAHHPTEIQQTISMAKLILNSEESLLPFTSERLIAIFQPHRYSRTKDLLDAFGKSFSNIDLLFLAPIYSAGENPIEGINLNKLKSSILLHQPNLEVIISSNFIELENVLIEYTKENDLLLFMGAGDITTLSNKLTSKTKKENNTLKTYAA